MGHLAIISIHIYNTLHIFDMVAFYIAIFTLCITIVTSIILFCSLKQTRDSQYMNILQHTVTELHKLYESESDLLTKDKCEMYAIRLLDTMSILAHFNLTNKINDKLLLFLKYDFSVSKRVMQWFANNKLDEKYGDNADTIWSNLTKYYKKHQITMGRDDVLPTALLNFSNLETSVFVYGILKDDLVRTRTIGRYVVTRKAILEGYNASSQLEIEGKYYDVAIPDKSSKLEGLVMNLSSSEIIKLDEWETNAYKRMLIKLVDGTNAWVYTKNEQGRT